MTEVNIQEMKKQYKLTDIKQDFKDNQLKQNFKKQMIPKKQGMVFVNQRRPMPLPQINPQIFKEMKEASEHNNTDLKDDMKNIVLTLASRPITTEKRASLKANLQKHPFINNYLENNVYLNMANLINDNIKFGLCYASVYVKTLHE